ncbi:MAG: hypothetical protein ACLP5V_02980 [Candidatus Bathyarchaeia archaeon]
MTNLRWLKWAVGRHFRRKGLAVSLRGVRVGNGMVDGEVTGRGWRMALELKSTGDDVIRGLGQLSEALANGYDRAALVTTMRRAKHIDPSVFDRQGFILLGVDSRANVRQVYPTYASGVEKVGQNTEPAADRRPHPLA